MNFDKPNFFVVFLLLVLIAVLLFSLSLVNRFLFFREPGVSRINRLSRQVIIVTAMLFGVLFMIWLIPGIDAQIKGDLFKILGLILSVVITLSSTTFVSNAMAGLMLRAVRNFRRGDFVQIGDHFGRVTERGLLHTEIQTEDRDLTTLPNLYLVTNPIKVVRSSGTIISTTLTLGYNIPRLQAELLLVKAAEKTELQESFVQILELGDCAVHYRIAGFLTEVKHLLSARSNLRCNVLDVFHEAKIEIVSPVITSQRSLPREKAILPKRVRLKPEEIESVREKAPEAIQFDKADLVEKEEARRAELENLRKEIEELERQPKDVDDEIQAKLEKEIDKKRHRARAIERVLEAAAKNDE